MQEIEKEQEIEGSPAPADPNSQPVQPVLLPEVDTQNDDPEEIFLNAVAEKPRHGWFTHPGSDDD